jgi:RHS repeat-associated protein
LPEATLAYDPLGRLSEITAGSTTTRFLYDGEALVAEYDGSNAMTRRYVHGDGADVPEVSYTGSSLTSPNFLVADERGSVIAVTDAAGNALAINSYDEYGIPGASNSGRFQYTGQTWLPELGVYYYKARMYSPYLGRFFQTDPIGLRGGMNTYAYVGNDPVNLFDPLGLYPVCRVWPGYTYTERDGTVVVVNSSSECHDSGGDLSLTDQMAINYINSLHTSNHTQIFTVLPNGVQPVSPDTETICPAPGGRETVQLSASVAAYLGGVPGHKHGAGMDPGAGPEDGTAAAQSGLNQAYVGTTTGVIRVDRMSASDYSVSLLSGTWGVSQSTVLSMIDRWNLNNGMTSSTSVTQQASHSGNNCTIHHH